MVEEALSWRGLAMEQRLLMELGFLRSDAERFETAGIDEKGKPDSSEECATSL